MGRSSYEGLDFGLYLGIFGGMGKAWVRYGYGYGISMGTYGSGH